MRILRLDLGQTNKIICLFVPSQSQTERIMWMELIIERENLINKLKNTKKV